MLYQEYKAKLDRRRSNFERFWKFRGLILTAVTFLIALTSILLNIKGTVTEFYLSAQTVSYGESIFATAECIFGKATVEYLAEGESDWTLERPIYAGKYECRPVGKTLGGSLRVGKTLKFEILPAPIEVTVYGSDYRYGDKLDFSAELFYGDRLEVTNYSITRENGTLYVTISDGDISAISADGRNVTASYDFSVNGRTFAVNRRPLTLQMPSDSVEYDGEEHTLSEVKAIGALIEGHRAVVTADAFIDVGEHENIAKTYRILDENGEDVTHIYDVTCIPGTLTILPCKVSIQTGSLTVEYDGRPHSASEYKLVGGGIIEGHTLNIVYPSWVRAMAQDKNGAVYSNIPESFRIESINGVNMTSNYDIDWIYGTVTIYKRKVKLSTEDYDNEYTGEPLIFDKVTTTEDTTLADGHRIKVETPFEATDVGSYINEIAFDICDGDVSMIDNYLISIEYGNIKIRAIDVNVVAKSDEFDYDGAEHEYELMLSRDPVNGQEFRYSEIFSVRDVGTYYNNPSIGAFTSEGEDVSGNYNFIVTAGKVIVNPYRVTVTTVDEEFLYDGKEHQFALKLNREPVQGQEFRYGNLYSVRDAGEYDDNMLTVKAYIAGSDVEVTLNYDIEIVYGKITINKVPISITFEDVEIVYDGTVHTFNAKVDGAAVDGEELKIEYTDRSVTDAGTYSFDPTVGVFADERETSLNYDFALIFGEIVVKPIELVVTAMSENRIYDGKEYVYDLSTLQYDERLLAGGHELRIFEPLRVKTARSYYNAPEIYVYDGNGVDVTRNYRFDITNGTVVVDKRPIHIATKTEQITYDGREHFYGVDTLEYDPEDLADGQSVALVADFEVRDVRTYENAPEIYLSDGNENVASNYAISLVYGKVTVLPIELTLTTKSQVLQYVGGKGYTFDDINCVGLVAADSIEITPLKLVDAGEYKNSAPAYNLTGEDGRDVAENYVIGEYFGTIIISPLQIVFDAASETFTYDGVTRNYDVDVSDQLAEGDVARYDNVLSIVNVGEYKNAPTISVYCEGRDVTAINYEIIVNGGKIVIEHRHVSITTSSKDVWYMGINNRPNIPQSVREAIERSDGLLNGDSFRVSYGSETMTRANESGYENKPEITIFNGVGDNVTKNYIQDVTYGTIIVRKRNLKIELRDASFEYNGELQGKNVSSRVYDTFKTDGSGLAPNEIFSSNGNSALLRDCGETKIVYMFAIQAGINSITTDNYNIHINEAYLRITPKVLKTMRTNDAWQKYDGTPLTCAEVTADVVDGHTVKCTPISALPEQIECGTSENKFAFTVRVFDKGEKDVTNNYDVSKADLIYGQLTVTERGINIITGSGEFTYDALKHSVGADKIEIGGDGLVNGHRIAAEFKSFTEASTYDNVLLGGIAACRILDVDGTDVTRNYTIDENITCGKVTILPRKITLVTRDLDAEYDGNPHRANENYFVAPSYSFAAGHKIVPRNNSDSMYPMFEEVGEYDNLPLDDAWKIVDENNNEIASSNYIVSWQAGKINIIPRKVTVLIGSKEDIVYDGQWHRENSFTITSEQSPLADGQSLSIICKAFINANTYQNTLDGGDSFTISREDGTVVNPANYKFTWISGIVKIARRPLTVRMADGADWNWIYDGTCHLDQNSDELFEAVYSDEYPRIQGHEVYIELRAMLIDAGEYYAGRGDFGYSIHIKADAVDVMSNYSISDEIEGKSLTIYQRLVYLYTEDGLWVHDNMTHSASNYSTGQQDDTGLVLTHRISRFTPTFVKGITDGADEVKYVQNIFSDVAIADGDGLDVTKNYTVQIIPGQLRVKSPIEVYIYSIQKTYDGKEVSLAKDSKYQIKTLPPDVSPSDVHISLVGSLTKPGALTLQQVSEECHKVSYVSGGGVNRIDFVGQDYIIRIDKQRITIKTLSIVGIKGDSPLYANENDYVVSNGKLVDGHTLHLTVTGVLGLDEISAFNTIVPDSISITDSYGNDVTDCYEIELDIGILSWDSNFSTIQYLTGNGKTRKMISGWMVHPLGLITSATPFSGYVR